MERTNLRPSALRGKEGVKYGTASLLVLVNNLTSGTLLHKGIFIPRASECAFQLQMGHSERIRNRRVEDICH